MTIRFPDYKSWQSELTVNGNALDNKLKWTTGLFFFQEDSPNDGGLFYLFLPSAVTPPAGQRQADHLRTAPSNSERNTSYAAYAQATYSIWPDTRLTAGVRYTYDERHAYDRHPAIRHCPATAGDHRRRRQRRLQSRRLHL